MKCPKCKKEFELLLVPIIVGNRVFCGFYSGCCEEDLSVLITKYKLKLDEIKINSDQYEEYLEEKRLAS